MGYLNRICESKSKDWYQKCEHYMLLNTLSPDTSNLNSLYFIKCRLKLGTCVLLIISGESLLSNLATWTPMLVNVNLVNRLPVKLPAIYGGFNCTLSDIIGNKKPAEPYDSRV